MDGVECQGFDKRRVELAAGQDGFISQDIDDFSYDVPVFAFLCGLHDLAFESEREFFNDRSVYMLALDGMEACLLDFPFTLWPLTVPK